MSLIEIVLLIAAALLLATMFVALRRNVRPSRWTDVAAAVTIVAVILLAAGVR